MNRFLTAAALAACAAIPAYAAQHDMMSAEDMTCADLMGMDEDGQMQAMASLEVAAAEADGTEMSQDEAMSSGESMMPGTMSACEGNPEMMAMEAMQEGM